MTSESSLLFARRDSDPENVLAQGRSVVGLEAHALTLLGESLNQSFVDAVNLLLGLKGRVVVTGIGKSGHVGRKIASTLASTGTPALFMHTAEAAHGDLGMLTPSDVLLAISNSGATIELLPVIAHAKALTVPIIAISARANASLMREADVPLLLPAVNEACASTLAPTTSTTMMIALGDALAVATMRARGMTRESFRLLHPGGTIGSRFSRVAAVMHGATRMPIVSPDCPMPEAILVMTTRSLGIAGVVGEGGKLIGVITDGDLRRHIDDLLTSTAGAVMTANPVTVSPNSLVEDALALMNDRKITALFVVDDHEGRPIGVVHIHDFLRLGS